MKTRGPIYGLAVLIWSAALSGISFAGYSQAEISEAAIPDLKTNLQLPRACLGHALTDTVLPLLCNGGQGLLHYETVSLQADEPDYSYCIMGDAMAETGGDTVISRIDYYDMLWYKQHITKQYSIKFLQKMMQDNSRIDLESLIRGIRTGPLF